MNSNHQRALEWAASAEAILDAVTTVIERENNQATPGLALQVAKVQMQLALFYQAEPDVGDRALVA